MGQKYRNAICTERRGKNVFGVDECAKGGKSFCLELGMLTWNIFLNYSMTCADLLVELERREKAAGIQPDSEIDTFMKVE